MTRRVVVTGMSAITPVGNGLEATWEALCNGKSGIDYITCFDASTFPTCIAGEVKNFDLNKFCPECDGSIDKYMGKHSRFALAATKQALDDSGLDLNAINRERAGIYLGAGEGEFDFDGFVKLVEASWDGSTMDFHNMFQAGLTELNAFRELEHDSAMPGSHIASIFGLYGINCNCLTACAASSQAIGEAFSIIQRGTADIMVSGGSHSMIHPLGVMGFNLLTALSTQNDEPQKASKPFDIKRDGFVLGEGTGILILEELEHAKKRGARIYGEIIGYGTSSDAFRITDSHPEGRGAKVAINLALKNAGISPSEVGYISAHGTSTSVNDTVETIAIKQVFGEQAYNIPISSIKSMTGHLIAAAGAVELTTCFLAFRDNIIPPTINYNDPDPQCDLDYVPNTAREIHIDTAMSNSFGFGGQNVSLAVRRYNG